MANAKHLELLKQGVDAWNAWREKEPFVKPDLSGANLRGAELVGTVLSRANLGEIDLSGAKLRRSDLSEADLSNANLCEADLNGANLSGAKLVGANLTGAMFDDADLRTANLGRANLTRTRLLDANLKGANLVGANLNQADLTDARLGDADLAKANLLQANLTGADLFNASLRGADLTDASLYAATLVETDLTNANLTGCQVYGISAWRLKVSNSTKQQNLVITRIGEPKVTADDLEVAQFLYLMLHNEKIRGIIDTITSKVVLILGRFTPERKAVLDALRNELRNRSYVPVVFDFEKSQSQTTAETVALLARMARFVIADITDAKSVLQELRDIVPNNPMLAVQPLVIATQDEPGMFDFFKKLPWVSKTYRYDNLIQLTADLDEGVLRPVEAKVLELRGPAKI